MLCEFECYIHIYWWQMSWGNTRDSPEKGITSYETMHYDFVEHIWSWSLRDHEYYPIPWSVIFVNLLLPHTTACLALWCGLIVLTFPVLVFHFIILSPPDTLISLTYTTLYSGSFLYTASSFETEIWREVFIRHANSHRQFTTDEINLFSFSYLTISIRDWCQIRHSIPHSSILKTSRQICDRLCR